VPSLVLASLTVLLLGAAIGARAGREVGLLGALVLATTPQFLGEAANGRVDMTLTAVVAAAQLVVAHCLASVPRGPWMPVLGAFLAGLAMLAKGPVGPALVALTALGFCLSARDLRPAATFLRPRSIAAFAAAGCGWYVLAYLDRGWDFVAKQLLEENAQALLGSSRFPSRSAFTYAGPLAIGGLPWTLVLPWAIGAAWRAGGTQAEAHRVHAALYLRHLAGRRWVALSGSLAVAVCALACARALGSGRWRQAIGATAAIVGVIAVLVASLFVPARAAEKSVCPFAEAVRRQVPAEDPITVLGVEADTEVGAPFMFHLGRQVIVEPRPLRTPPEVAAGYYVLTQARWDAWGPVPGWLEVVRSPPLHSRHRRDLVLVRRLS
jgi:hypothetical protein